MAWVIEKPYAPHAETKIAVRRFRPGITISHQEINRLADESRDWDFARAYQLSGSIPYEIGGTKHVHLGQFIASELEKAVPAPKPAGILERAAFRLKGRGLYQRRTEQRLCNLSISRIGVTLTSRPARGGRSTMLVHLSVSTYAPTLPSGRLPKIWPPHIKAPLRTALAVAVATATHCDQ